MLEKTDFDSIQEQDLLELLEAQVPEGLRVDYKLTCYGKSGPDKRELLKDISAFANLYGGHLVLGVKEKGGIPTDLIGMDINTDSEMLRMEQILRSGLEPPIPGIRIISIPLSNKKKAILVRVPRSWNPPHRVISGGVNRFYIRNSAGVHEPSIEELRTMFNQSTTALEKACRFRDERINEIISRKELRPPGGGGRLIIHIVPVASFSGMINLDLKDVHAKHNNFWPLGSTSKTSRFNYHGFINERGGEKFKGYTQIFRNGILEATKSVIMSGGDGQHIIRAIVFEGLIFAQLDKYIHGLKEINVPPPLIVMFTLEGVQGALYDVGPDLSVDPKHRLPDSILNLPECLIDEYGKEQDHHKAVQPAFDALWNASGFSHSQFFNNEGMWVGKNQ